MAKGWSFGGLVAALKSAAFLNAGTARGDVVTVDSKGNLVPYISIQQTNMSTYTWSSGEYRFVATNSTGMPEEIATIFGSHVQLSVAGINDNRSVTLLATSAPHLTNMSRGCSGLLYGRVSGSSILEWTYEPLVKGTIPLTKAISPNSMSNAGWNGFYSYPITETGLTDIGYPINEAGILSVQSVRSYQLCIQEYTTFNSKRKFTRNFDGSSWSSWIEYARLGQNANFGTAEVTNLNCTSLSSNGDATFGTSGATLTLRPVEQNQVSISNKPINYGGTVLISSVQNSFYSDYLTYGTRRGASAAIDGFSIFHNGQLKFDFNVVNGSILTPNGTVATQEWVLQQLGRSNG